MLFFQREQPVTSILTRHQPQAAPDSLVTLVPTIHSQHIRTAVLVQDADTTEGDVERQVLEIHEQLELKQGEFESLQRELGTRDAAALQRDAQRLAAQVQPLATQIQKLKRSNEARTDKTLATALRALESNVQFFKRQLLEFEGRIRSPSPAPGTTSSLTGLDLQPSSPSFRPVSPNLTPFVSGPSPLPARSLSPTIAAPFVGQPGPPAVFQPMLPTSQFEATSAFTTYTALPMATTVGPPGATPTCVCQPVIASPVQMTPYMFGLSIWGTEKLYVPGQPLLNFLRALSI
jgi:hypothetical protein